MVNITSKRQRVRSVQFAFCINMHFPVHQYKKILYSEGQQPWNHPQWSAFSHQWMDQASMWISVDVGFTSWPDNSSYFLNVWDAARCRHGANGRVWFHFQICILEHAKAIKSGIPTIQLTTFLHLPWIDAVALPPQAKNKYNKIQQNKNTNINTMKFQNFNWSVAEIKAAGNPATEVCPLGDRKRFLVITSMLRKSLRKNLDRLIVWLCLLLVLCLPWAFSSMTVPPRSQMSWKARSGFSSTNWKQFP